MRLRKSIINEYLKLLDNPRIQKEYTIEWYLQFKDLLIEIDSLKSDEQQTKLFDILDNTNNVAISIYLELENILEAEK